jgi:hypothetical protein
MEYRSRGIATRGDRVRPPFIEGPIRLLVRRAAWTGRLPPFPEQLRSSEEVMDGAREGAALAESGEEPALVGADATKPLLCDRHAYQRAGEAVSVVKGGERDVVGATAFERPPRRFRPLRLHDRQPVGRPAISLSSRSDRRRSAAGCTLKALHRSCTGFLDPCTSCARDLLVGL